MLGHGVIDAIQHFIFIAEEEAKLAKTLVSGKPSLTFVNKKVLKYWQQLFLKI
jgi:hypothetical protein